MATYPSWSLREEEHIARLILNRPAAMNSLTSAVLLELQEATSYLRDQDAIWAVVLEGQGPHFSVGFDVHEIRSLIDQPEAEVRQHLRRLQRCLDDFEALEKPTVAALHGFCLGGGLLLALCCDFRVASQRTVLQLPEVQRGIPIVLGTQRVARAVGPALVKELVLLARRLDADAAWEMGLLHQVVPPERLNEAARSLAEKFLRLPPRTVALAKRILNRGRDLTLRDSQELEIEALRELRDSPDLREALDSFFDKRSPHYTGR